MEWIGEESRPLPIEVKIEKANCCLRVITDNGEREISFKLNADVNIYLGNEVKTQILLLPVIRQKDLVGLYIITVSLP